MELTKEQIKSVENYLDKKEVHYLDVRIEALDHIISELENNTNHNTSFKEAYNIATKKWNTLLQDSSSVYLGYAYVKPKIVIEKMKKYGKPYAIKIWLTFMLMLFLIGLKPEVSISYVQSISLIATSFIYLFSFLVILGYLSIYFSKQKTSYSFLYKTQVLPFALLPLFLFGSFITKKGNLDLIQMVLLLFCIFTIQLGVQLWKNHFSAVKKYTYKWN